MNIKKLHLKHLIILSVFLLIELIFVIFVIKNLAHHQRESKAIDAYIEEFRNEELTKELAFKVSDKLRNDFNVDRATWKNLNTDNQPFLRFSCFQLLKHKEAACGGGTRVLVRLLNELGFDATRVTLYGDDFRSASGHTLVSIVIDGKEIFIDSINSKENFNQLLKNNDINAKSFNVASYSNRNRSEKFSYDEPDLLKKHITIYNYSAIPMAKLVNAIGLNLWIFNLDRPNKFVSALAESIYLIAVLFFITLLILVVVIHLLLFRFFCKKSD